MYCFGQPEGVDRIMAMWILFGRGIALGLATAAPVGPIGILCVQRTLSAGRLHGYVSGLGAATSDLLCSLAAMIGILSIPSRDSGLSAVLTSCGALLLFYLGFGAVRSRPGKARSASDGTGSGTWQGSYVSTMLLTITNPMTWVTMTGGMAGWGLPDGSAGTAALGVFAAGVFAGSMLWWIVLSTAVDKLREHFSPTVMLAVNRCSGILIMSFGVWGLFRVFG